ncbi:MULTISPECIES: carbon-nitrogen family hydrolase [Bacillaceae]|uniref:carbon-nitrogen family hydrolase n=1 Tax=Bacillaceae TaxID=186817 RepID=UPI001E4304F2|nr:MULTISPECIES: carbon-nitrogen family hydrolase [Bacillaceae]MCE4048497.1 carbon-nitrogen family hydrolase [Bacillus sp. Au-Bac7]MDL0434943.1 carbon-nitrogen family hydrolase [Niallia sp. SS-2023]UPO89506.1 carbon-nitrogen family hydrolase [Niallia sp. Man26]
MEWNISIIQMDIVFGDPKQNFLAAEKWIKEACAGKQTDIVILPELWTTGYDLPHLDTIADKHAEKAISFLQHLARSYQVHIIGGSVANKKEDGIFNTLLVINKEGELIHTYDKLHLFKLMDEHLYLQSGTATGLFQLNGETAAGLICYDIRFPEWVRTHTSKGANVLFVSAEWPLARLAHWRALLIARAIENQCYVVACNRSGSDPANVFAGHSMIIDPWGEIVGEAGENSEILARTIDLAKVSEVRNMIPIFSDRRPEYYG